MSSDSRIEWTDATWNVVSGCTRASAGCDHCYAVGMTTRLEGMSKSAAGNATQRAVLARKYAGLTVINGKGDRHFNGQVRTHEEDLTIPLGWKKSQRIFVNSMSDLFHKDVPFDFIDKVFAVMALTPQHTYQILTKRPERMAEYLNTKDSPLDKDRWDIVSEWGVRIGRIIWDARGSDERNYYNMAGGTKGHDFSNRRVPPGWPLPNVWLGASVENQQAADERIPHLLKVPAAVRFLSCEPLLGPVDVRSGLIEQRVHPAGNWSENVRSQINWVIVGGESGPGARPFVLGWGKEIVRQCKAAGVPVFVKQIGAHPTNREGVRHSAKDSKGGDWLEWPEELRVREFPKATVTA
jgi:protein gp37